MDWYFERQGRCHGPVSIAELDALVKLGDVRAATLLWRPGFPAWTPASMVPELGDRFVSATVAEPQPPPPPERPAWPWGLGSLLAIAGAVAGFVWVVRHTGDQEHAIRAFGFVVGSAIGVILVLFAATLALFPRTRSGGLRMVALMYSLVAIALAVALALFVPEWHKVALARDETPPYQLTPAPDAATLEFKGGIGPGAAHRLRQLAERSHARRLVIESEGGLLDEALEMSAIVEKYGMLVEVRSWCASACVAVLASGHPRRGAPGAVIGLHSPDSITHLSPWFMVGVDESADDYFGHLRRHGLPSRYIQMAKDTAPKDLRIVQAEELVEAGFLEAAQAPIALTRP